MIDALKTFSTLIAGNFSISCFLGRKASGSFLTDSFVLHEKKRCTLKLRLVIPIHRFRGTCTLKDREGERDWEYGLDYIMYSHRPKHTLGLTHGSKFRAVPLRNETKLHCMLMVTANHKPQNLQACTELSAGSYSKNLK